MTYGLETLQLNKNHLNRLDAFQVKGLRRILEVPPTFIDRTWTNAKVLNVESQYRHQELVSATLLQKNKIDGASSKV